MHVLWRMAIRIAFRVALGLFILAPGGPVPVAGAQQAAPANNGVVGMAIDLRADAVGAPARLVIAAVAPGGPAQNAGIRPGDEIVAIDGRPITGKSLRDVVHMIRGKVGTAVTLALNHKGQTHAVSLIRVEAASLHPQGLPRQPSHG